MKVGSASTTSSATAISSATLYASATAKTTCSTTVTYSGSSSTAKVSSTTVDTVEATSTNKTGASASTTASTTVKLTGSSAFAASMLNNFKLGGYVSVSLFDFYDNLKNKVGTEEANLRFAQTIAACCYEGVKWDMMSGWDEDSPKDYMIENGLSDREAESIVKEIREQHKNALSNNTIDMAHMFFTIATYLNEGDALGSATSRLATGFSDEIIAGFGGDVFGVGIKTQVPVYTLTPSGQMLMLPSSAEIDIEFIEPSMGNDDYMADLDSVNLSRRLLCNENESIINVVMNYYEELSLGENNRAKAFLENMGGVEKFYNTMKDAMENGRDIELANRFYNAVIDGQQIFE